MRIELSHSTLEAALGTIKEAHRLKIMVTGRRGEPEKYGYNPQEDGNRDASKRAGVPGRAAGSEYVRAPRAVRSRLLDEMVTVTGYHRKAVDSVQLRRLRRPATSPPRGPAPTV